MTCNRVLRNTLPPVPIPRTCRDCGLGPCTRAMHPQEYFQEAQVATQIIKIVEVVSVEIHIAEVNSSSPAYWDKDAKHILAKTLSREETTKEGWRELSAIEKAILAT